jgi:hypothetical protein
VATTIDADVEEAERTLERLESIGVSMADVGRALEDEGVSAFTKSFEDLVATLEAKRTGHLRRGAA